MARVRRLEASLPDGRLTALHLGFDIFQLGGLVGLVGLVATCLNCHQTFPRPTPPARKLVAACLTAAHSTKGP